jgi:hypothetical protein
MFLSFFSMVYSLLSVKSELHLFLAYSSLTHYTRTSQNYIFLFLGENIFVITYRYYIANMSTIIANMRHQVFLQNSKKMVDAGIATDSGEAALKKFPRLDIVG